jgi:hypothetical protein
MFRLAKKLRKFPDHRKRVDVVVLGHQKGGTTAIAKLLGRMCQMPVSVDPFYEVDRGRAKAVESVFRGEVQLSAVARRHPTLFWQPIVKDADFTFLWTQVAGLYPEARFVYVARHPVDTIRSVLNRLGLPGDPSPGVLPPMRNPTRHWELILAGSLPRVPGDDYVEKLAHRWQLAADTYATHRNRMLLVRYEDFLRDKVSELTQVAGSLGLVAERDVFAEVDVPYQPPGNDKTSPLGFFGSRRIDRIVGICARGMQQMGYRTTGRPE